jgi:tripartite-type tricarboxylate transporter receptor subunit TctC
MDKAIVDKINAAVKKVLQDPAVKKRIEDTGSLVVGNSPQEFAKELKEEYETYKQVVAKQKLTLD